MNSDRVYDVIVVGAGPAGSACATVLARNGLDVLLIDRALFPREKICGDCLNPRSWKTLEDLGAADAVKTAPHRRITGVRVTSWRGRSVHSSLPRQFPQPLIAIRRGILDQILLHNAQQAGATVLQKTQVVRVEPGQPVRVSAKEPNGRSSFSCRYLVGADGRNSAVAASSCTAVRHQRQRDRIGLQWFAPSQPSLGNEVLLALLPYGYFGIVNVDEASANIAMAVDPRHVPTDHRAIPSHLTESVGSTDVLRSLIHDLTPLSEILTTSPINPRTNLSSHPQILLAGDARQTVEPFTGEGIAFALSDGAERASAILVAERRSFRPQRRPRTDFWVNHLYSPLLRHPTLLNAALAHTATSSQLLALTMRTVFR